MPIKLCAPLSYPEIVDEELKRGSIARPFNVLPSLSLRINRFRLIPKSEPHQWRMIIDLSFPAGASVNDSFQTLK